MQKNIKLFVSCHKPGIHVPANGLVTPIQVGALGKAHLDGMLHDDEGDNISRKNFSYCELTGQYWAWKHVEADYYGFLHYRRYFNFSGQVYPIHHEPFIFGDVVLERNDDEALRSIAFDEESMRRVIEGYDFIAPEAIATPDGVSVYEQYRMSTGHHIEDFDTVLDIIEHRHPEVWPSAQAYINQEKLYVCNMFVMRSELFHDYSSWLFSILEEHERLTDISHYTPVGRRVSGYLGERLCGIYLTYLRDKGYAGKELQRVYFRDTAEKGEGQASPRAAAPVLLAVELGPVTRGSGKIYAQVKAPAGLGEVELRASSSAEDGRSLPAKVARSAGGPALVLAVVGCDQVVRVEARDAMGTVVAASEQRFSARGSKIQSQKNTLLKNQAANAVRNCDERRPLEGDVRVEVARTILDVDGTDIVQGSASIPLAEGEPSDAFAEVLAIGPDGSNVSGGEWTCLGDVVEEVEGHPGYRVRTLSFSVRVPRLPSFVVWVRFPNGEHQDGFACMEPGAARGSRRIWDEMTTPACNDTGYERWFLEKHRASSAELAAQRRRTFEEAPVFSIVVPLFRTPLAFLREMVASVEAQSYVGWELVLVNASPEDAALSAEVAGLALRDRRIHVVTLAANRGITENTNEGIAAATGDFVCFLDHDDVLEPDCLYSYVAALAERPQIDLFYCDEDKLEDGHYKMPFFKPDWNPDLLLGMNYVCHFLTVRRSIVSTLDAPTKEYDGSQDWHMTFRAGELAREVCHVPRVLYHWRIHENSTARSADQKDYTLESSRLAVETHLARTGVKGTVLDSPLSPRRFVVSYDLGEHPLVSIVIPNKDSVQVLHRCLTSVLRHSTYDNFEVVIVENNSCDPETFAYYERAQAFDSRVRVVTMEDQVGFNFSRIINFGAAAATGDYVLMLNNDTEVETPGWIEELLGPCMRSDVGITGARLLFPDGTIQHAGVTFGWEGPCHLGYLLPRRAGGNLESMLLARDMSAVTGACLLVRKSVFDEVGGLDEGLAVNYNDVDFCLRVLELGLRVVWCPTSVLYHYESVSRGSEASGEKALRFRTEKGAFMERWPQVFEEGDPNGNPNFERGNIYERLSASSKKEAWE